MAIQPSYFSVQNLNVQRGKNKSDLASVYAPFFQENTVDQTRNKENRASLTTKSNKSNIENKKSNLLKTIGQTFSTLFPLSKRYGYYLDGKDDKWLAGAFMFIGACFLREDVRDAVTLLGKTKMSPDKNYGAIIKALPGTPIDSLTRHAPKLLGKTVGNKVSSFCSKLLKSEKTLGHYSDGLFKAIGVKVEKAYVDKFHSYRNTPFSFLKDDKVHREFITKIHNTKNLGPTAFKMAKTLVYTLYRWPFALIGVGLFFEAKALYKAIKNSIPNKNENKKDDENQISLKKQLARTSINTASFITMGAVMSALLDGLGPLGIICGHGVGIFMGMRLSDAINSKYLPKDPNYGKEKKA